MVVIGEPEGEAANQRRQENRARQELPSVVMVVVVQHGRKAISPVCPWQLDSQRVCAPAHGRIWHLMIFAAVHKFR
jgi:hypothetical protein